MKKLIESHFNRLETITSPDVVKNSFNVKPRPVQQLLQWTPSRSPLAKHLSFGVFSCTFLALLCHQQTEHAIIVNTTPCLSLVIDLLNCQQCYWFTKGTSLWCCFICPLYMVVFDKRDRYWWGFIWFQKSISGSNNVTCNPVYGHWTANYWERLTRSTLRPVFFKSSLNLWTKFLCHQYIQVSVT